jgi:hypothetical protein
VDDALPKTASLASPNKIRVDFTGEWPTVLFHHMPPPQVTSAMLQSSALAAAKKVGVPVVNTIIKKYGADLVSQVPPQCHPQLYTELIAL